MRWRSSWRWRRANSTSLVSRPSSATRRRSTRHATRAACSMLLVATTFLLRLGPMLRWSRPISGPSRGCMATMDLAMPRSMSSHRRNLPARSVGRCLSTRPRCVRDAAVADTRRDAEFQSRQDMAEHGRHRRLRTAAWRGRPSVNVCTGVDSSWVLRLLEDRLSRV